LIARAKTEEIGQFTTPAVDVNPDDELFATVITGSDEFGSSVMAQRIQAGLSSTLGVPMEAIDVVLAVGDTGLEMQSVVVYLSADDARRLADRNTKDSTYGP